MPATNEKIEMMLRRIEEKIGTSIDKHMDRMKTNMNNQFAELPGRVITILRNLSVSESEAEEDDGNDSQHDDDDRPEGSSDKVIHLQHQDDHGDSDVEFDDAFDANEPVEEVGSKKKKAKQVGIANQSADTQTHDEQGTAREKTWRECVETVVMAGKSVSYLFFNYLI